MKYTKIMDELIKRGLKLSKTVLFRLLTYRAEGFLKTPTLVLKVLNRTVAKLSVYQSGEELKQDMVEKFQTVYRLVKAYANGDYREVGQRTVVLSLAILLYFLLPVDIIPDIIPGLGLLDDVSLLVWLGSTFNEELNAFQEWEGRGNPAVVEVPPPSESD